MKSFGWFSATRRFDDARLIRIYGRTFGANLGLRLRPVRQASILWPSVLLPQGISPFANGLFSLFRHGRTHIHLVKLAFRRASACSCQQVPATPHFTRESAQDRSRLERRVRRIVTQVACAHAFRRPPCPIRRAPPLSAVSLPSPSSGLARLRPVLYRHRRRGDHKFKGQVACEGGPAQRGAWLPPCSETHGLTRQFTKARVAKKMKPAGPRIGHADLRRKAVALAQRLRRQRLALRSISAALEEPGFLNVRGGPFAP